MMNYNYGYGFNQPQVQSFLTLPVSNIQEAISYRVAMDGTPTYFHNISTGEIYIKKTNRQTGVCDFETFSKVVQNKVDGITLETLNKKIDDIYGLLNPVIEKKETKVVKDDK